MSKRIKFKIAHVKNTSPSREDMLRLAVEHINQVILDEGFYVEFVRTVEKQGLGGELSGLKNMKPEQLFNYLFNMNGLTLFYPLWISFYYSPLNTVGKIVGGVPPIFINTKLFSTDITDLNAIKRVGSNLLHEYTHLMGADHDFKATERRNRSVSYLVNKVYEEAFDDIYGVQPNTYLPTFWGRVKRLIFRR